MGSCNISWGGQLCYKWCTSSKLSNHILPPGGYSHCFLICRLGPSIYCLPPTISGISCILPNKQPPKISTKSSYPNFFFFSENSQKILKFKILNPKNGLSLRVYENMKVLPPHPGTLPSPFYRFWLKCGVHLCCNTYFFLFVLELHRQPGKWGLICNLMT